MIKSGALIAIANVQHQVEAALTSKSIDEQTIRKVSRLIEEVYAIVLEYNLKKRKNTKHLLGECSLIFDDQLILVLKDNGKIFDITSGNLSASSRHSFTVSSLMKWHDQHVNTVVMCCNRNAFLFDYQ